MPDRRFGQVTPNWTGYETTASAGHPFTNVTSWWYVPYTVPSGGNNQPNAVSFWAGVGDAGSNGGMWQGGIEDDSMWVDQNLYVVQTNFPWVEFIAPNSPCCTSINWGLRPAPGDEIASSADAAGPQRNEGDGVAEWQAGPLQRGQDLAMQGVRTHGPACRRAAHQWRSGR